MIYYKENSGITQRQPDGSDSNMDYFEIVSHHLDKESNDIISLIRFWKTLELAQESEKPYFGSIEKEVIIGKNGDVNFNDMDPKILNLENHVFNEQETITLKGSILQ